MRKLLLYLFVLLSGCAFAQVQPQIQGAGAPTNPCYNGGQQYVDTTNHVVYGCPSSGSNWANLGLGNVQSAGGTIASAASDPATCNTSDTNGTNNIYYNTVSKAFKYCSNTNTWSAFGAGGGNVGTGQANVYGAFLQDFSAATMEIPEAAGFTTNVDSTIGLDTTGNCAHFWTNNADSFNVATTATSTTTTFGLFATAVPCIYTARAIAAGDLPTTLTSGTAITNAALTTPTLGTPASGTLTNATGLPLNGLVGANAAATLTESAVSRPITFAGVETANLTYPYVFQNTNSTTSNTSGALLANCAGTDSAATCFMVNNAIAVTGLLVSFNTGGTVTNGVISGQTPMWSLTGNGAVTQAGSLTVNGSTITAAAGSAGGASVAFAGDTAGAGLYRAGSAVYGITNGTNEVLRLQATGVKGVSGGGYGFTASSSSSTGAFDTCMGRSAAGVFSFNGDTACGDTTGKLKAAGYISVGTKFTSNAGCTEGTLVGGATAGKFTVGQGTACTIIITMGNTATAPNGWTCMAYDQTAVPAVAIRQTASTTTTCSLLMTVATSDVITFAAIGY